MKTAARGGRKELWKEVRRVGEWVLYAAAIVGAWSMAEAVMRLVDALDKKNDRLSAGTEKRSGQIKSAE